MISLKSKEEIELMKRAGAIIGDVFDELEGLVRPGTTTKELDREAEKIIRKSGGAPAFKGYKGFPGNICTSINNVVVHGIPKERGVLKKGDIISIDIGVLYKGYYADAARTFKVGDTSERAQRLIDATRESLFLGINEARANSRLFDISHAIQSYVESNGYNVVRALVGHGIGSEMHESPEVPNYGEPNRGVLLKAGMTLAIEPMVNEGGCEVEVLKDGWTVITKDRSLSAHFEHTVLITRDEPEILTQWQKKKR